MHIEIVGEIEAVEVIAAGVGIRQIESLRREHGGDRWSKRKGNALVRLGDGTIRRAEVHWYEAHGVGKRRLKIKRFLD